MNSKTLAPGALPAVRAGTDLRLYGFALAVVLAAVAVGVVNLQLGAAKIVLLPMIWALLIGGALGLAHRRLPGWLQVDPAMQRRAAAMVNLSLMLLIAKLGLMVGASVPKLMSAGWALAFQELGHFLCTMLFGLPLALLLGIKQEAVGATFSVGREPSLAIIGEKYGMHSPEGRGVLAEYITSTLFGAIVLSLLASLLASLHVFDPLALAMGAGIGSGSIMAAASGAIAAQQPPELAKEVATFAAASNLLTTTVGTYFTLFVSLPLTAWAYRRLEPVIGRRRAADPRADERALSDVEHAAPSLAFGEQLAIWIATGVLTLLCNWITYHAVPSAANLAGIAIIIGVAIAGQALYRATGARVVAVIWVSLVGMVLTHPAMPIAGTVNGLTGQVNFLALTTPILAFAGLSIAKDVPAFRRLGWRIVLVSLVANIGSFVGGSVVAQFFMHQPV